MTRRLAGFVLAWAGISALLLLEFAPVGCRLDPSIAGFLIPVALACSLAISVAIGLASIVVRRIRELSARVLLVVGVAGLMIFLIDRLVSASSSYLLGLSLPLVESPSGMASCLAVFTPDYLNGSPLLFRWLLVACLLLTVLEWAVVRFAGQRKSVIESHGGKRDAE